MARRREADRARSRRMKARVSCASTGFSAPCRECDAPIAKGQPAVWLLGIGLFCNEACAAGWGPTAEKVVS
jgi:hypothetical protein